MTNQEQHYEFESVLELLSEQGFDGMREAMETLLNETMKLQRAVHLNAAPHQRTEGRKGYANGFGSVSGDGRGQDEPRKVEEIQCVGGDSGRT